MHESGHTILGLGDEYRETDPALRRANPTWARQERVRSDLTYMGEMYNYGRFSLFHERHFRFAQVFLEAAFPGCTVTLNAVPRFVPDFRLSFDLNYGLIPGGSALMAGGGFDIGFPLTRMRQLELLLGARGRYLLDLSGQHRDAFLAGIQLGLERRSIPGGVGYNYGFFGGGGAYHQLGSEGIGPRPAVPAHTLPYLEGGGSVGINSPMLGGVNFSARFEAAGGSELTSSPEAMRWLRIGVRLGGEF